MGQDQLIRVEELLAKDVIASIDDPVSNSTEVKDGVKVWSG
jgi:hypothetical protein